MFANCYHLCTTAHRNCLLCYDETDYKHLWNIIAVCAMVKGITVYCICLMSNHFHILLSAPESVIRELFGLIRQKIGMLLKCRYPEKSIPGLQYELFPVGDRKQFCREVAYILRNPYKAGISSPFSYRWNSASAYFPIWKPESVTYSSLSVRKRKSILRTHYTLPGNVLIADGMIVP